MGIVRYPVQCPGCKAAILLRLAVGHAPEQPFFYVCGACRAATRGCLVLHGGVTTSLQLEDGEQKEDEEGCSQIISINPELPALQGPEDLSSPGGSAFILHHALLGEGLLRYSRAVGKLHGTVGENWSKLSRLTTYYLNRDWRHFDKAAEDLLPDEARDFSEGWRRDHAFHLLYDLLLAPVVGLSPQGCYPRMKEEWNARWGRERPHFKALAEFAKREAPSAELARLQRDLFAHVARYVQLRGALLPGALLDLIPEPKAGIIPDLRMFRDDFAALRDLYVQVFETCHHGLRFVLGAVNADERGAADRFPAWPSAPPSGKKDEPRSLDRFDKLTSADKSVWLSALPVWQECWEHTLDRQLRNDIGHASVRHDLQTGTLISDKHAPIAYTVFLQKAHRIIHPVLALLGALKLIRVYSHLPL